MNITASEKPIGISWQKVFPILYVIGLVKTEIENLSGSFYKLTRILLNSIIQL